jgi:hypothetical protein
MDFGGSTKRQCGQNRSALTGSNEKVKLVYPNPPIGLHFASWQPLDGNQEGYYNNAL